MILFIAPNPAKITEREGFMQRVAAIDELFATEDKVYFEDVENDEELSQLVGDADMIYVHSIYRSRLILEYYYLFGEKIITDMHGVVPEEEQFAGNTANADALSKVERVVFEQSNKFVAVTSAMVKHFKTKYKSANKATWIVLPIFEVEAHKNEPTIDLPTQVVYAGGSQPWQNVTEMVDAINDADSRYKYVILTHSPDAFNGISSDVLPRVVTKTVKSSEVADYYKHSQLGFILRDDVTVNRVACPTKLIEYLGNGIVPIVKSQHIGDFYEMGYKFITLKEFKSKKPITHKKYVEAVNHNYRVFSQLSDLSVKGANTLVGEYEGLNNRSALDMRSLPQSEALNLIAKNRQLNRNNAKLIDELNSIKGKNLEQSNYISYLEDAISNIRSSKKWRLIEALNKPKNAVKRTIK